MIGEENWFKKKKQASTFVYYLGGKFIILVEMLLYILSMKCVLIDIIPQRLKNSYLDFPLTCFFLLGYLLTFRSLFLASYTDCASIISKKNYMSKEEHEKEKKKKEEKDLEKKRLYEEAEKQKKLKELEAKKNKKSTSCCRKENKKAVNETKDQNTTSGQTSTTQIDSSSNVTQQSQDKSTNEVATKKGNKKGLSEGNSDQNQQQHKHSKECAHAHCSEHSQKNVEKSKACLKCNIKKDKFDHHCSMCNKCVYRLDHHCFFIGQCVGDYNYLYFISYVFLSYIMTLVVLIALIPEVIDFFNLQWDKLSSSFIEVFILLLGGLLFHLFTMILLISHMYYISNEVTYLENLHNLKRKEYSPLEWICIVFKCQSRAKLYDTFTARWYQIFGNQNFSSLIFPEGTKIKID